MHKPNTLCVISHTHWDREWYMSLEWMRLRLVDLIDRCLELLDKEPDYVFHLDAQTIVLEDYLSIRTDRRPLLENYIRQGRLSVGPWYLQNDYYLTSGEATVRNLLEGTRLAGAFEGEGTVGYAPDQFGNISQLPQILRGFGIDNFVFGRGACRFETQPDGKTARVPFPSEFWWQGADDSRLLAVYMNHWYNNAQRLSSDLDRAQRLVEQIEKDFEDTTATPYLLLMNGVDHLEAQDDLPPVLQGLRERGLDIRQMRLDDYIHLVQSYVEEQRIALHTHTGELRSGSDGDLLKGTLSSRVYLKQWNVKLQNRLEQKLEPLYAMLALSGGEELYPEQHFRYMWKELMKNHPHDSICGCSRDEVHRHMEDNFERLDEMTTAMLQRGMELAAGHITLADDAADNYGILVANTTAEESSQVVRATVDLPAAESFIGFTIRTPDGDKAVYRVLSRRPAQRDVFSPLNLPGTIAVDRYEVELLIEKLPGYSFRAYTITRAAEPVEPEAPVTQSAGAAPVTLENAALRITVAPDGRVDVLHKLSGRLLANCLDWEDTADRGDSYIYQGGEHEALYGRDYPAEITLDDRHPLRQSVSIRRALRLPAAYDFDRRERSAERVDCPVTLTIVLKNNSPVAELIYTVDNRAKDHRLRLLVRTGIFTEESAADIPFDVVYHRDADHFPGTSSRVLPNTSFAALQTADTGTAVLTAGQHEYEHMGDTLAFTVLRATGAINRHPVTLEAIGGDQWQCPGNQCIRKLEGRMGLYPFTGELMESVAREALQFRTQMPVLFFAADPKKFAGGRPAVQDTTIAEYFYLPDPCPTLRLQSDEPILRVSRDSGVVVTAFKKAERRGGFILRLLNLQEKPAEAEVEAGDLQSVTSLSEREDVPLLQNRLSLKKKELLTLRIRRGSR